MPYTRYRPARIASKPRVGSLTAHNSGPYSSTITVATDDGEVEVAEFQGYDESVVRVVWPDGEHAGLFASWEGAFGFVRRAVVVAADMG